jgi:hypothetical protein
MAIATTVVFTLDVFVSLITVHEDQDKQPVSV